MRPVAGGAALFALMLLLGCATLVRGDRQAVEFTSAPPGAQVELAGQRGWCRTPCILPVPRLKHPLGYSVALGGHEPFSGELIPTDHVPVLLGIAVILEAFLILPGIVDIASGALWEWPLAVSLTLPPEGQGAARAVVKRE